MWTNSRSLIFTINKFHISLHISNKKIVKLEESKPDISSYLQVPPDLSGWDNYTQTHWDNKQTIINEEPILIQIEGSIDNEEPVTFQDFIT